MAIVKALAAAIAAKLFADEIRTWLPWLARQTVALAVRILHEDQRARYSEEWSSYIAEVPGEIGKVLAAAGLVIASIGINTQLPELNGVTASEQERYEPGRATFGLLPEPESRPGSFITSVFINVLILAIALFIGFTAKRSLPLPF